MKMFGAYDEADLNIANINCPVCLRLNFRDFYRFIEPNFRINFGFTTEAHLMEFMHTVRARNL